MKTQILSFLILVLLNQFHLHAQYQQNDWGVYFGGPAYEYVEEIVVDFEGNAIIAGKTQSKSGIAVSGAHQSVLSGKTDAFLAKFNNEGQLLWSTYFGGPGTEYAYTVAADKVGNIYIGGGTTSTSGIATEGSLQPQNHGNTDGFVAKFDPDGKRLWSTYFGGTNGEWVLSIATDNNLNVYFTGYTGSKTGIATPDAHQKIYAGEMDCYLTKLTSNGELLYSTYFGGDGEDRPHDLHIDHEGNIILNGTVPSAGLATEGVHQETPGGSVDAFVSKWTSYGDLLWCTYYGGASSDRGRECASDEDGNIYLTGFTTSKSGIATSGSHQPENTLKEDGKPSSEAYLVKFNSQGQRLWGTYFGGSSSEYGRGVKISANGNVLISGVASSKTNIATSDGFLPSKCGASDAYLAEFTPQGVRVGATYYGGSDKEPYDIGYGPAIALDDQGNVFIAPTSESIDLPNMLNDISGDFDAVITKFSAFGVRTDIITPSDSKLSFTLYPNPCQGTINLMSQDFQDDLEFRVFNLTGTLLLSAAIQGKDHFAVDVSHLPSGTYMAEIRKGAAVCRKPFIIEK